MLMASELLAAKDIIEVTDHWIEKTGEISFKMITRSDTGKLKIRKVKKSGLKSTTSKCMKRYYKKTYNVGTYKEFKSKAVQAVLTSSLSAMTLKKTPQKERRRDDDDQKTVKTASARVSKRPRSWKKEEEEALMECYKKHDRKRKLVRQYAIWEQIKHDPAYCEHWKDRSKNSIQKKARSLLGLTSKKKK
eukprot:32886_1